MEKNRQGHMVIWAPERAGGEERNILSSYNWKYCFDIIAALRVCEVEVTSFIRA